jgi:hypothetical protein
MTASFVSSGLAVVGPNADPASAARMIRAQRESSSGMTPVVPEDDDGHESRR